MAGERFAVGQVTITQGAHPLFDKYVRPDEAINQLLRLHQTLDQGTLSDEDYQENLTSLSKAEGGESEHSFRILSSFIMSGQKVWIITEADRTTTTILLPEEY